MQHTIDILENLMTNNLLLSPFGVSPPNRIAVLLSIIVRVKSSMGGGLFPVMVGVNH